jgi:O-antigen chain-terminating methyltransferase
MNDGFYRAFEERYRGPRELIKGRLQVYLPFVVPLLQAYPKGPAFDLGCGRGEWLELLQESGFDSQGVDLDDGMLSACRERGLNVANADAIVALKSLPDESQLVVSGFHIVEHISFEQLRTVVSEARRVLKPGGLLIMETPNPENIVVGTANFYLDPTHQRPIPSQLLSFIAEYAGFERVKTLRLQEPAGLADNKTLTLLSVLNGVSPDYAIVAQKTGAPEIIAMTAPAFEADYGLSLVSLANSYDQQIKAKAEKAEAKAEKAEAKAEQAEAKAEQAEAKAEQAKAKAEQAKAKAEQAKAAVAAIYRSKSWRLTIPLRWAAERLREILAKLKKLRILLKRLVNRIPRRVLSFINRRPKLRRYALAIINRLGVYSFARALYARVAYGTGIMGTQNFISTDIAHLTPRARQIYANLKAAIETHDKENN